MIRPLDVEGDGPAVVGIVRESNPTWVLNVAGWCHWREHVPPRAGLLEWVAVIDREIVGVSSALRRWFAGGGQTAFLTTTVRRDRRRRGIGAALYAVADEHARGLGCSRLATSFPETPDGVRFAKARGFRRDRVAVKSCVDPRGVDLTPLQRVPAGVGLASFSDLHDRLEDVFAVHAESWVDEPSSEPVDDVRFGEWLDELRSPMFSHDGSFVVLDAERVVSVATLYVDHETGRARNGGTGTLRSHRGRGLATLAKLAVIRWTAEQGITAIWTTNDETNAPMLAINRKLGYRPTARDIEAMREL